MAADLPSPPQSVIRVARSLPVRPESLALAIAHHHASEHIETDDPRVSHLIALAKLAHSLIALSRGTQELPEMLAYLEEAWRDVHIGEADGSALCQRAHVGLWNHVS